MAVEYNGSTVAAIDMDTKIGYKQFFSEGGKFQYSGTETPGCVLFGNVVGGEQMEEKKKTSGASKHFTSSNSFNLFLLSSSLRVKKQPFPGGRALLGAAVPSPAGRGRGSECPS